MTDEYAAQIVGRSPFSPPPERLGCSMVPERRHDIVVRCKTGGKRFAADQIVANALVSSCAA
jgi:hypothetical protein